jgi:hypothetical protein
MSPRAATPPQGVADRPIDRGRRRWLKALALALALGPLGRVVARARRRRPDDLPPVPWIGHC